MRFCKCGHILTEHRSYGYVSQPTKTVKHSSPCSNCAWHGAVYKDQINGEVLFTLKEWGFQKNCIPKELFNHNYTSGLCKICYDNEIMGL